MSDMSEKIWLTCNRCGKKWRCRDAEKCENFGRNAKCPCDSCYTASDEGCDEVESFDVSPEKVIFT